MDIPTRSAVLRRHSIIIGQLLAHDDDPFSLDIDTIHRRPEKRRNVFAVREL